MAKKGGGDISGFERARSRNNGGISVLSDNHLDMDFGTVFNTSMWPFWPQKAR
jgi:hypothetical protein